MSTDSENQGTVSVIDRLKNIQSLYSFERLNTAQLNWLAVIFRDNLSWIPIFFRFKRWKIDKDKSLFIQRIGLSDKIVEKEQELSQAIDSYAHQSFYNLFYYRRKLIRENVLRYCYSLVSMLIVTLIPAFTFLYTDKAVGGILPEGYNFLQPDSSIGNPSYNDILPDAAKKSNVKLKSAEAFSGNHIDRVVHMDSNGSPSYIFTAAQFDSSATFDPASTDHPTQDIPDPRTSQITPRNTEPRTIQPREEALPQELPEPTTKENAPIQETKKDTVNLNSNVALAPAGNREEAKGTLSGLEAAGIIGSLLLTSLLAMHQLLSQWAGKRKFRAHFHQAKMDLMNVHFQLENNARTSFGSDPEKYDFEGLKHALQVATQECRNVVNGETKKYFEMSATPAVELKSIFSSTMNTANGLLGAFTRKKYSSQLDALRKEVKDTIEHAIVAEDKQAFTTVQLKIASKKQIRLQKKELELSGELAKLEAIVNPSEQEQTKMTIVESRLYTVREIIEENSDKIELLEEELQAILSRNS